MVRRTVLSLERFELTRENWELRDMAAVLSHKNCDFHSSCLGPEMDSRACLWRPKDKKRGMITRLSVSKYFRINKI